MTADPSESRSGTGGTPTVRRRDILQSLPLALSLAPGLGREGTEEPGTGQPSAAPADQATEQRRTVGDGSVRATAAECLSLDARIEVRRDLYGRLEARGDELHLREQLTEIGTDRCHFALPPKAIPDHPRMSAQSAIHFDHYNSSVTDLPAPEPEGEVSAKLVPQARVISPQFTNKSLPLLGTCLNFIRDDAGTLYAFCGSLDPREGDIVDCSFDPGEVDGDFEFDAIQCTANVDVVFSLVLFDDALQKVDDYEVVRFPKDRLQGCNPPPVSLGYFVVDGNGRVIVVRNETDVEFLHATDDDTIVADETFTLGPALRADLSSTAADQPLAQVLPSYDSGYWAMALGDRETNVPAYVARLDDDGSLVDTHEFSDGTIETIDNGMTIDESGLYVLTSHRLYKVRRGPDGGIEFAWSDEDGKDYGVEYERTPDDDPPKPGTGFLSGRASGSTPTLFGREDDLVAFTDNATPKIHVRVHDRETGDLVCSQPVFRKDHSANENTLVAYDDHIVVQNWFGANCNNAVMSGVESGLTRIDVDADREGCSVVWDASDRARRFASTPTVRLSTRTGLLYAPVQVGEGDDYAMAFLDFVTGQFVRTVPFPGKGLSYRLSHLPPYIVPGGRLVQPVRLGYVVFQH